MNAPVVPVPARDRRARPGGRGVGGRAHDRSGRATGADRDAELIGVGVARGAARTLVSEIVGGVGRGVGERAGDDDGVARRSRPGKRASKSVVDPAVSGVSVTGALPLAVSTQARCHGVVRQRRRRDRPIHGSGMSCRRARRSARRSRARLRPVAEPEVVAVLPLATPPPVIDSANWSVACVAAVRVRPAPAVRRCTGSRPDRRCCRSATPHPIATVDTCAPVFGFTLLSWLLLDTYR